MKDLLVIGLIFLAARCLSAQEKVSVPSHEIIIGRNYRTNADIIAKKHVFPESIYLWSVNDSTSLLTLQLRGTNDVGNDGNEDGSDLRGIGDIAVFDLRTQRFRWKQMVNYQESTIDHSDQFIIKSDGYQTSCLDIDSGKIMWSAHKTISYMNPSRLVGVGSRRSSSGNFTNAVEGIDLNTGQTIWRRSINRNYNLNEILPLNDSVVIVSANGLHSMHLKTGMGWDYNAHTGMKDHTNTVLSNIFNLFLSILLGGEFEITTGHDLITDLVSNTLVDSTGIYMADKNSLVCLDKNGKLRWKSSLPGSMVSRSTLFFRDSLVYLVNNGWISLNYEPVKYGKTFIAAFSAKTGKKVFLNRVGYKNDEIVDYLTRQDTLYLISSNRVFKYSLQDGSELFEQKIKIDSVGELTRFGGKNLFIVSDSLPIDPVLSDSAHIGVYTTKNDLLYLDSLFNITDIIPDDVMSDCYLETKGYKFIDTGEMTLVIDKKNVPVAELYISGNAILRSTTLFEVQGKDFVEIDLNQILVH